MDKNITTSLIPEKITRRKNTPEEKSSPESAGRSSPAQTIASGAVFESSRLPHIPLTSLTGCGVITSLSPSLETRVSRRLEDLGFTAGEKIRRMMPSAFGGGAAYIIKGSVIVLRDGVASQILVNSRTGGEGN